MHGAVESAVDRQIGPAIGILGRQSFVNIYAKARGIAGVHHSVRKSVSVREDAVGFLRVVHEFLNAKVMHAQIEMQGRGHAHGAHVRGAVATSSHLIKFCQARNFPQM